MMSIRLPVKAFDKHDVHVFSDGSVVVAQGSELANVGDVVR